MDYSIVYSSPTGNTEMLAEDPENTKFQDSIDNFDQAASHPDQKDCDNLKEQIKKTMHNM